jgi:hypothetical protein
MSVSKLDSQGDWTFGHQLAGYITGSEEVTQSVVTRVQSFKNDWFLDSEAEIDWFTLLSNRNTEKATKRQIERTVVNTAGVKSLDELKLEIDRENRKATIYLVYTDIFNEIQTLQAGV